VLTKQQDQREAPLLLLQDSRPQARYIHVAEEMHSFPSTQAIIVQLKCTERTRQLILVKLRDTKCNYRATV